MKSLWKIIFVIGVMLMISAITGVHQLSYNSGAGFSLKWHTVMSRTFTFIAGAGLIAWFMAGHDNPLLQRRYTRVVLWIMIGGCALQSVSLVVSGNLLSEKVWAIITHGFVIVLFLYLLRKKDRPDLKSDGKSE